MPSFRIDAAPSAPRINPGGSSPVNGGAILHFHICWLSLPRTRGSDPPFPHWLGAPPPKTGEVIRCIGGGEQRRPTPCRPLFRWAMDHKFLDFGNRLGRIEVLGADLGAVHDGVTAVKLELVLKRVETLIGHLVAAVRNPAISLKQSRRAEIFIFAALVAIPPIRWARCRTART